jgi:hypothetical protein
MASLFSGQLVDASLSEAINDATKERLNIVLHAIIQQNPHAAAIASGLLLADDVISIKTGDTDKTPSNEPPRKKRKRYELCTQCDQEYDVTDNNDKSCNWHDGTRSLTFKRFLLFYLPSEMLIECL